MGRARLGLLLLVVLLLAACERGGQTAAGLTVQIDSPASGASIPTGREVIITSTARSNASQVQRIELHINGELIREDGAPNGSGQSTLTVAQQWVPTEAGTANIEVIAYDSTGRRSTPATITLVVQGTPMATTAPFPTRQPSPTAATATMTAIPSPEATATTAPALEIGGIINTDANVRNGPGVTFDRVDGIWAGTAVTAVGRNAPAEWIEIRYGDGKTGWVLWSLAGWQGDIRQLPVTR